MQRLPVIILMFLLATLLPTRGEAHILAVADHQVVSFDQMLDDLLGVRLVFIGEMHDSLPHHRAQLQVIKGLVDRGAKVAIGLEMFRDSSQAVLDEWIAGDLSEPAFEKEFNKNWSSWPVYRDIFLYARSAHLPMIGLNLKRSIPRQVSRSGFASLSGRQLKTLPIVRCDVDATYQNYIRRALGSSGGHGPASFKHFCEAQIVWDAVMADNLIKWLKRDEDRIIVVLTGNGHAWKFGIPEQIRRREKQSYRVLLPEVPGRLDARHINDREADYLLEGVDQGPLH